MAALVRKITIKLSPTSPKVSGIVSRADWPRQPRPYNPNPPANLGGPVVSLSSDKSPPVVDDISAMR